MDRSAPGSTGSPDSMMIEQTLVKLDRDNVIPCQHGVVFKLELKSIGLTHFNGPLAGIPFPTGSYIRKRS